MARPGPSVVIWGVALCVLSVGAECPAQIIDALPKGLDLRPQPWQRRTEPILSALTTKQDWCRVILYTPHVLWHDGRYRMWYLGTSTGSRSGDCALGYAESTDGIVWREHPANPILTDADVPWGSGWQTPHVLFDEEENIYKMWFVSRTEMERGQDRKVLKMTQSLGYATSRDGLDWNVRPKPIYESGRRPSVIKEGPGRYRMWMNSRPSREHDPLDLYKNIYEFSSTDGIHWDRAAKPAVQPSGKLRSCVYPFVVRAGGKYLMCYGGHIDGGIFEIFSASSDDGTTWTTQHDAAAFPASRDKKLFDGRYTSTPCVVAAGDRVLLFYSARDWNDDYVAGDGTKQRDGSGVYNHVGVAVLKN